MIEEAGLTHEGICGEHLSLEVRLDFRNLPELFIMFLVSTLTMLFEILTKEIGSPSITRSSTL
eukprot:CAMPEP_0170289594 /NCGR_PEP_ID=MMETSP0116_2-20130129/44865_1 /TAXON_ID=400756 /ORGANISM="Durinskia baltica, Strain CSIRO CS-38" /LENGTH=62 /DNA_ID=CAMNT_0010541033 /DNA_START=161 /DNA_END=346 /DNA_ORIENTATION=-